MIDEKKLIEDIEKEFDGVCVYDVSPSQAVNDFVEIVDRQPKVGQWIPCSERLPENEQEVEITYVKKHWKTGEPLYFTCRAFYTDGTMNTEESGYVWDETDNWEYNEKLDAYIIPKGWWECVSFAEEFGAVDDPVIAWMPPPKPYKESED